MSTVTHLTVARALTARPWAGDRTYSQAVGPAVGVTRLLGVGGYGAKP